MSKIFLRTNPYIFLDFINIKEKKELVIDLSTGSFDFSQMRYSLKNNNTYHDFEFKEKKVIVPQDFLKPGELEIIIYLEKLGKVIKTWTISLVLTEEITNMQEFKKYIIEKLTSQEERIKALEEKTKIIL